jgi:hypothetical protein
MRLKEPGLPQKLARKRVNRDTLSEDGRLTLLAADHPGRMVTAIRDEPVKMGNRHEFLSRILRVLASSPFDGLLATSDVIDELFILEHLMERSSGVSFLNLKILLGSVNRGGLAGSVFEPDYRPTGYDAEGIHAMNLDGAKLLLRFDANNLDSAKTLGYCVETIRACNDFEYTDLRRTTTYYLTEPKSQTRP